MKHLVKLCAIVLLALIGASMVAHNPETHAGDVGVVLFIIALVGLTDLALG